MWSLIKNRSVASIQEWPKKTSVSSILERMKYLPLIPPQLLRYGGVNKGFYPPILFSNVFFKTLTVCLFRGIMYMNKNYYPNSLIQSYVLKVKTYSVMLNRYKICSRSYSIFQALEWLWAR